MSRLPIVYFTISSKHGSFTIAMQRFLCISKPFCKFMSNKTFLSHFANFLVIPDAINSDSNVECEIHVCFFDTQEMVPPPRVNTQPDVELLSFVLVTQLASEYPSSIAGSLETLNKVVLN